MNIRSRRALSVVLLLALLIPTASCGTEKSPENVTESGNVTDSATAEQTTLKSEPDFPDLTFDNEEILFLTEENSYDLYTSREIFAGSETGELINDSVYKRNLKVEERFKVKIAEERVNYATGQAQKNILAGDDVYDVVMPYMNSSIKNALEGLYMNLYDVPNLNLENPWWDQRANDNLTVGGKLYFTTGDISILDNECTMVLFFNKSLIEDNKLDNPYELVKSGKWTMDKLFGMIEDVSADVNGDSEMKVEDDRFGLFCQNNVPHSFWFGSGERISKTDKNGDLVLSMKTERSSEMIPYILENCLKDNVAKLISFTNEGFAKAVSAFMGGRILFAGWALGDINSIRDCKFDFGILPYPKYEESQAEYYNLISTVCVPGVSIPVTNAEPEKAGLILEALAYYSVDTLTAAYYDNALHTRYVRDEESGDMLDIIFATRVYDLGFISNVGGLGQMMAGMFQNGQTNFTSTYESLANGAQGALDDLMKSFREAAELQK